MAQVKIVLSGVYRRDKKTLAVLQELRNWLITPSEAREKIFGFVRVEPSLCCLFLLVQWRNEFICQVIDELKEGKVKIDFAIEEILSIIDEECPRIRTLAVARARKIKLKEAA